MEVPHKFEQNSTQIPFDDAMKQYKRELLPNYSQLAILGRKDVSINLNFIPIGIVADGDKDDDAIRDSVKILDLVRREDGKIIIRGMPGTGKTTLMRKLMFDLCQENSEKFPLYFKATVFQEIPDFEEKKLIDVLSTFVEAQSGDKKYSDIILSNDIFRKKFTYIIIDGLDEMRPEWQKIVVDKLKEFTIYYPLCNIIITSRVFGISADVELNRFTPYNITELRDIDIENYIAKNVDTQNVEQVVSTILDDDKLLELAKTPFMLALMCIKPDCLKKGATRRAGLYKETTAYLLGERDWDRQRPRTPLNTVTVLEKALKIIAVKFFKLDMNDQFPGDEAKFFIRNNLGDELGDISVLDFICKKSGLLQYSNGAYTFVHRSIWEYFVALGMLEEPLPNLLQMANVPTWEEPIRMFVGLTDSHNIENVIKGLWKRNRALTLRCLHETREFPNELLNDIYNELTHQERINLVSTLRESAFSIGNEAYQKSMIVDTVSAVYTAERNCEVLYNYITLLEEKPYPECLDLIIRILDLENAEQRRNKYLNGNYCFELINVYGDEFNQGNAYPTDEREYPQHRVVLSDFYMSKNLITNKMYYDEFPFISSENERGAYSKSDFQPVNNVNWYEAYIFARWIGCELPTESEWEYCCRSGGKDDDYFKDKKNISDYGWYGENSDNKTHEVGLKRENSFGFCDMLGNLREWCQDWHTDDYYKICVENNIIDNPKGPEKGDAKVLRGGCFDWAITNLRPTYRNFNRPNVTFFGNGFRVVYRQKEEWNYVGKNRNYRNGCGNKNSSERI